jgi:hypothetical protein
VGTLRLGSFAPQYDKVFNDANKAASAHGESDDDAMVSGFCAVIRRFAASADAVATHSDVLVLDLRGNMGGFGREARLFAEALAPRSLPRSFDVFNTGKPGTVTLKEEPNDSPCGHIRATLPLIVLTDAGTRSAGELMAAWLWAAGALVAGERTIGAGGRFEYGSSGIVLPATGYGVRFSGNFTLFDPAAALKNGEMPESEMVDTVAAGDFAPSRQHYFAIQAAGMKPDLAVTTTIGDLRDGGVSEVGRILAVWKTSRGEKSTSP